MITRLFLWLFWPCLHQWETEDKHPYRDCYGSTGTRFILRCTRCGDVRKKDLV